MSDPALPIAWNEPVAVNGWTIYAHPVFLAQYDALTVEVDLLRKKGPDDYTKKNPAKTPRGDSKTRF